MGFFAAGLLASVLLWFGPPLVVEVVCQQAVLFGKLSGLLWFGPPLVVEVGCHFVNIL